MWRLSLMRTPSILLVTALIAGSAALPGTAYAQPAEPDEPALPPGLGDPDEPALPPGLGEAESVETVTRGELLPSGLHGFAEARYGPRIGNDPAHSEEATLAELRLQAEYANRWKGVALETKGDLALDAVTDEIDGDLRVLRATLRPADAIDLRLGRQVITWGTGDMLFVNDLFPKDWQSFFSGRDEEYLKAPADAVRLGWFAGRLNLDLVYTPEFEPDRYIRGERISFFSPIAGGFVGDQASVAADVPGELFADDEIALRLYGNLGSFELAGYGYRGFWKSPAGFDPTTMSAQFPRLDVFGASARGPLGPGIGNLEVGYYASRDDSTGSDPLVDNSELRLLAGYEMELVRELTGGFQYYLEQMRDYDRYQASPAAGDPRDRSRHVVTARLTRLLMNQTVTLSLFAYLGASDDDGYLRPKATYKLSDFWTLELGGNLFFGDREQTFFGRFEDNSNVYAAARFAL